MRTLRSALMKALLPGGILLAAAGGAWATDLPPGGSLEPIPTASLPAGAVEEQVISRDFDISWTQIPFVRHVTGTITQRVYRLPDDTLIFRYFVSNDSTSEGGITQIDVRDFSDGPVFTTDVTHASSFICLNCEYADRAIRDIYGSSISFQYDLGIATGYNTRTLSIQTDATSYRVSSCGRFFFGSGRVTVRSGSHYQTLCGFAAPVIDSSPPIVEITAPSQFSCNCNPIVISGRAYDPNGFDQYVLEYSAGPNGPWTSIGTFTTPVSTAGPLASWNTTGVPENEYFVRLTATNTAGLTSSVTTVIYVNQVFNSLSLRSPDDVGGQPPLLGGSICFDGTVWDLCGSTYTLMYRSLPGGVFAHVDPANPVRPGEISQESLGYWQTNSGPTAVPDGLYQVRVQGTDSCGITASVTQDIRVDNTPPVAVISSPVSCSSVSGLVAVNGVVADANLSGWALQYTGGNTHTWVTIASGNGYVNGLLGNWNTAGLPPCCYALRLLASDRSAINCGSTTNQAEYLITVDLGSGCRADFNGDNVVNSQDYFDFLTAFFSGC
jgi:hypothetical protein